MTTTYPTLSILLATTVALTLTALVSPAQCLNLGAAGVWVGRCG
ncbi:MAG: hypothetical protein AAFX99_28250 [Myxococcota bacterium]